MRIAEGMCVVTAAAETSVRNDVNNGPFAERGKRIAKKNGRAAGTSLLSLSSLSTPRRPEASTRERVFVRTRTDTGVMRRALGSRCELRCAHPLYVLCFFNSENGKFPSISQRSLFVFSFRSCFVVYSTRARTISTLFISLANAILNRKEKETTRTKNTVGGEGTLRNRYESRSL